MSHYPACSALTLPELLSRSLHLSFSPADIPRCVPCVAPRSEWVQNQHRDSQASYIGHTPMLHLFSAAQNKSLGRVRYEAITRMVRPIGRNPLTAAAAAAKDDE